MIEFGSGNNWAPTSVFTSLDLTLAEDDMLTFEYRSGQLRYACILSRRAGAERLFVSICSFIARDLTEPPGFDRFDLADHLGGHVLAISDPTLMLNSSIALSCGLGTRDEDPVPSLIELATAVAVHEGIATGQIVYWAHSAAAFFAGQAAARAPAGRAVLINPLLDLPAFRWHPATREILRVFGIDDVAHAQAKYPVRLSVRNAIREAWRVGRKPKLTLVQNRQDLTFWERQYLPFCRDLGIPEQGGFDPSGCFEAVPFDDEGGHGREPPAVLDAIVRHHLSA